MGYSPASSVGVSGKAPSCINPFSVEESFSKGSGLCMESAGDVVFVPNSLSPARVTDLELEFIVEYKICENQRTEDNELF